MKDNSMDKYDDLQTALDAARDNLKSLNDKIGREQFRDNRKRQHWDRDTGNGHNKSFDEHQDKRPGHRNDSSFHPSSGGPGGGGSGGLAGAKRARNNNVFSRLEPRPVAGGGGHRNSSADSTTPKPKVSSRVTKEVPRREDVVAAQSDEASRARNKRIFGSLLGTLNKFCQDESRLRGRVEKKAIIERKVEEQEMKARETSKMERRNLFVDRKKKLMEVRLLEMKMQRMQDLSAWEEAQRKTREFIRTKGSPKIFYRPKVMDEKAQQLLKESQREYDAELEQKRAEVQNDLVQAEERLQRELERALEEKPSKAESGGRGNGGRDLDRSQSMADEDDVEEGEQEEPEDGEMDYNSGAEMGAGNGEESGEEAEEQQQQKNRPRLVSQVVKSKVEVSIRNPSAAREDRRHVLQSAVNRKMIISVVNNTYEGGDD